MVERFVFQQSKIPAFNSSFGRRLARELWEWKLYFQDGRRHQDIYIRECDEAYLCRRYVPDTGAAQLIEDGEFGESDVHDYTNIISIRLALALMPRGEKWLTVSSRAEEDPDIVDGLQDMQMSLHYKAKSRRQIQRIIKQGIVRGSTYGWYDWTDRYRLRRLTDENSAKAIEEYMGTFDMRGDDLKKWTRTRQKELIFSGPTLRVLDYFDVWYEPLSDLISDMEPSYIVQRFRPLQILQSAEDDGGKKIYTNLDGLEPYSLEEIYSNWELGGNRRGSYRLFGAPPIRYDARVKLVPTYTIYMPYFKLDNYEWYDTYFTIALSRKGERARLINVEENPDDTGINHMLRDHYIDWYTQAPYGLSGVQFQLSKYNQKNFLQLLTITAMAHNVLPPHKVLQSAVRDDEELNFGAGGIIPIIDNQFGINVIEPLNVGGNSMNGEQFLRFMAEELKSSMGVDGLTSDNSARTLSKPRTATEINRDTTGGSFFLDNQAENMNDLLNQYAQGVYQLSQEYLKPNAKNFLEYERWEGQRMIQSKVAIEHLKVDRSVQVTGMNGQLNKEQEKQNLLQFFNTLAQVPDPAAQALKMWCAQEIAIKFGIKLPPELTKNPIQLLSQNPQLQMAVMNQALQNPQILEAAKQMIAGAGGPKAIMKGGNGNEMGRMGQAVQPGQ
jgi:hypothetical protein